MMVLETYNLHVGEGPLLISLPHVGTVIPDEIRHCFSAQALHLDDTDWYLEALYDFAKKLGASLIVPKYSRYVIDLNRPPENVPMYSGVNNTGLCPIQAFSGDQLYITDKAPTEPEIKVRLETYWYPYHRALAAELARIKSVHGYAILWDGHSIKSQLPWLFSGKLPDLNLGTASGASCDTTLSAALTHTLEQQSLYSHVLNGRFKGGYITRHFGQPQQGIHAAQLEMCFSCYMRETLPYTLDQERCSVLAPVLQSLIRTLLEWCPT